jgi:hypothetical protein
MERDAGNYQAAHLIGSIHHDCYLISAINHDFISEIEDRIIDNQRFVFSGMIFTIRIISLPGKDSFCFPWIFESSRSKFMSKIVLKIRIDISGSGKRQIGFILFHIITAMQNNIFVNIF